MKNELGLSHSPYLLQHKDNPVHWQFWGEHILEEARRRDLPVLVSIGYSTCHWCHVMAHESFEDSATADIMNRHFINVKIDREERPDLDHYFMNAVQLMGLGGGWPLHCFLTPQGKVFYGGTYFPPVQKYGRISWRELLAALFKTYKERREELDAQSVRLALALDQYHHPPEGRRENERYSDAAQVLNSLQSLMDLEFGGLGSGQKFPNSQIMQLLMDIRNAVGHRELDSFLSLTAGKLCLGGMYDHVAGGFYRYTVDRSWKIPHFEKMAYDHALINSFLSRWIHLSGEQRWGPFIMRSIDFWKTMMRSGKGLYYAALDADSEGSEGLYYLWKAEDLKRAASSEGQTMYCDLEPLEPGHPEGVLNLLKAEGLDDHQLGSADILPEGLRNTLGQWRHHRVPPSTDIKHILGWNSLIVTMYCDCFKYLGHEQSLQDARALMEAITRYFREDDETDQWSRLSFETSGSSGNAYLEDHAFLIHALFSLWQATGEPEYLTTFLRMLDRLAGNFTSVSGIYSFTGRRHADTPALMYLMQDSSLPNANALLARCYHYAYLITSLPEYRRRFESMMEQGSLKAGKDVFSYGSWFRLLPELLDRELVIKCRRRSDAAIYADLFRDYETVYIYTDDLEEQEVLVCVAQRCSAPMRTRQEVAEFLLGS